MILRINQEINDEFFQKLTDGYNSLPMSPNGELLEGLDIWLASDGGNNSIAMAAIELINRNKHITTINGYSHLCSNGFKIFFQVECKKFLIPETIGMYHLSHLNTVMYEKNILKNSEFDEFSKRRMTNSKYLEDTHKYVNFTDKEMEIMLSNKDLWFDYPRLLKMLNYNKKLFK